MMLHVLQSAIAWARHGLHRMPAIGERSDWKKFRLQDTLGAEIELGN